MTTTADLVYEIRTHLLYELKWLIYAADRFQAGRVGDPYVALIDSAAVHARGLLEFASSRRAGLFTLHALEGEPRRSEPWDRWANNRVMHMTLRERDKAPWPEGLDNNRPDRLMVMAGAVLDRLENGGKTIPEGPVCDAYNSVVAAARAYWTSPTDDTHELLAALYDNSRDDDFEAY